MKRSFPFERMAIWGEEGGSPVEVAPRAGGRLDVLAREDGREPLGRRGILQGHRHAGARHAGRATADGIDDEEHRVGGRRPPRGPLPRMSSAPGTRASSALPASAGPSSADKASAASFARNLYPIVSRESRRESEEHDANQHAGTPATGAGAAAAASVLPTLPILAAGPDAPPLPPPLKPDAFSERQAKLRAGARERGIDVLFVTPSTNLAYSANLAIGTERAADRPSPLHGRPGRARDALLRGSQPQAHGGRGRREDLAGGGGSDRARRKAPLGQEDDRRGGLDGLRDRHARCRRRPRRSSRTRRRSSTRCG